MIKSILAKGSDFDLIGHRIDDRAPVYFGTFGRRDWDDFRIPRAVHLPHRGQIVGVIDRVRLGGLGLVGNVPSIARLFAAIFLRFCHTEGGPFFSMLNSTGFGGRAKRAGSLVSLSPPRQELAHPGFGHAHSLGHRCLGGAVQFLGLCEGLGRLAKALPAGVIAVFDMRLGASKEFGF